MTIDRSIDRPLLPCAAVHPSTHPSIHPIAPRHPSIDQSWGGASGRGPGQAPGNQYNPATACLQPSERTHHTHTPASGGGALRDSSRCVRCCRRRQADAGLSTSVHRVVCSKCLPYKANPRGTKTTGAHLFALGGGGWRRTSGWVMAFDGERHRHVWVVRPCQQPLPVLVGYSLTVVGAAQSSEPRESRPFPFG